MPCTLGQWHTTNERIVVHYYGQNAQGEIEQFVNQWAASSNIPLEKRAYNRGIDQHGTSFTDNIAKQLGAAAIENMKQYTAEQVADWLVRSIEKTYAQEPAQF